MANCSVAETLSHIVCCYIFLAHFYISLLISSVVTLVLELFHMLKL